MENSFLVTKCGFCGEGYFVIAIGMGHDCEASKSFAMEPVAAKGELESPSESSIAFSGRRIRGY